MQLLLNSANLFVFHLIIVMVTYRNLRLFLKLASNALIDFFVNAKTNVWLRILNGRKKASNLFKSQFLPRPLLPLDSESLPQRLDRKLLGPGVGQLHRRERRQPLAARPDLLRLPPFDALRSNRRRLFAAYIQHRPGHRRHRRRLQGGRPDFERLGLFGVLLTDADAEVLLQQLERLLVSGDLLRSLVEPRLLLDGRALASPFESKLAEVERHRFGHH